jgi:hypothetical protein
LSLMRTTRAMLQVKYIAATVGYPRILAVNALLVCQYCRYHGCLYSQIVDDTFISSAQLLEIDTCTTHISRP